MTRPSPHPRPLPIRILIIIAACVLAVPLGNLVSRPFGHLRGGLGVLYVIPLILVAIWAWFTAVLFFFVIFREKPRPRFPAALGCGLLLMIAWFAVLLIVEAVGQHFSPGYTHGP